MDFIDINERQPKIGEFLIVKLKDGTETKCFKCGCVDEFHNGWASSFIPIGINIDVASWKYEQAINIKDIKISERLKNNLLRNDIDTLQELMMFKKSDIIRFYGVGKTSIKELESIIEEYGLCLKDEKTLSKKNQATFFRHLSILRK